MTNKILQGYFESIEPFNSSFKKVSIRTFAFGKNRNFSNITPQSFELAKNTIYSIPLVSKYIEEKTDEYGLDGDLSGHNIKLRKDSNDNWEIYQDTMPLGCVPSDAEIYFEDVNEGTEEEPDIKTYIVAKGCLLWMRYDAAKKIEEWLNAGIKPKVSMEIGNIQGKIVSDYFTVENFQFEAICALGSDKEPCFKMAEISNYSKENFEKSYSEMLKELKELTKLELNQQNQPPSPTDDVDLNNINFQKVIKTEGGNNVDEKLNLITKYANLTEEDIKDLKIDIDKYSLEEFDTKLNELSEVKGKAEFEMTNEQLMSAVYKALESRQILKTNYWNETYSTAEFRYCDIKGDVIITIDHNWSAYYGIPYSVEGDNVVLDYDNKVEYLPDWRVKESGSTTEFTLIKDIIDSEIKFNVEKAESKAKETFTVENIVVSETQEYKDLQSKFETLEAEKINLETQFSNLETEKSTLETKVTEYESQISELQNFQETTLTTQRQEAEEALFAMFSEKLSEEELKPFKETAKDFSIEQIEEKLSAFAYKKITNFEVTKQKQKVNIVLDRTNSFEIKNNKPYDDILEQYVTKE